MRHRIALKKLNRTSEHRAALLRNLAQSLIEHGQVTTTLPKARSLRPYFEKLLTLAIRLRKLDAPGALRARRRIHKLLGDRGMIAKEHREAYDAMSDAGRAKTMRMASGRRYRTGEPKGRLAFTAASVTHRLIESVAPRFEDRPGGYTRLVRLPRRRVGDDAPLAVLQLIGEEQAPTTLTKPGKSARRKRTDARYAMAVKASKAWSKRRSGGKDGATGESTTEVEAVSDTDVDSGTNAESDVAADS